jgi:NADH pyrophosphatase NudC (nudix superfamily)
LIKRATFYVPDFFVVYVDKNNKEHKELIEIKPADESPGYVGKVNQLKRARQAVNLLKWQAAMKFCAARGWAFRVANEDQLFGFKRKST